MKVTAVLADIMTLDGAPHYDICYTDPPWANQMVKFFQTIQTRDTGVVTENTLTDIFVKLGQLTSPNKPLYIEYSAFTYKEVVTILERLGHKLYKVLVLETSYKKPYVLLIFNTMVEPAKHEKGFGIVTDVVRQHNNPIVFDPFAGLGLTAKAVVKGGGSYIGSELNANRFAKFKAYADKVNAK